VIIWIAYRAVAVNVRIQGGNQMCWMKRVLLCLMLCMMTCYAGAAAEIVDVLNSETELQKGSKTIQFVEDGNSAGAIQLEVALTKDIQTENHIPMYWVEAKNENGESVSISGMLYIPYPDIVTYENHHYFSLLINHYGGEKQDEESMIKRYFLNRGNRNDSVNPPEMVCTPNGIRIPVTIQAGMNVFRFTAFYIEQQPGIQWVTLMGRLHEKIAAGQKNTDGIYEHFEEFEHENRKYGVKASYDPVKNTTIIAGKTDEGYSGGRIAGGVRLATYEWADLGETGEQVFQNVELRNPDGTTIFDKPPEEGGQPVRTSFLLDSGTYIFKDVLLTDNYFDIWAVAGQNYEVILQDSVKGVYDLVLGGEETHGGYQVCAWMENGGSINLQNDTTIMGDAGFSLLVSVYNDTAFTFGGKGRVDAGHGFYEYEYDGEYYYIVDDRPLCMDLNAFADTNEEAIEIIRRTLKNVKLDRKQFREYGPNFASTRLSRMKADRESFDIEGTITHGSVHAHRNDLLFDNSGRPQLVAADEGNEKITLKCTMLEYADNYVQYDFELEEKAEDRIRVVGLKNGGELYIPYPNGMSMEEAQQYSFTLHHYTYSEEDEGEVVYSTEDDTLEYTPQGLKCRVESFSPFMLGWEEKAEASILPETGDGSSLWLWMAALAMAAGLLQRMKRSAV